MHELHESYTRVTNVFFYMNITFISEHSLTQVAWNENPRHTNIWLAVNHWCQNVFCGYTNRIINDLSIDCLHVGVYIECNPTRHKRQWHPIDVEVHPYLADKVATRISSQQYNIATAASREARDP